MEVRKEIQYVKNLFTQSTKVSFGKFLLSLRESSAVWRSAYVYVCVYVCMSVRLQSQKHNVQTSRNSIGYILLVAVAWSFSDDSALCYVLPVLWMTLCVHVMGPIRRYAWSSSPGGSTSRRPGQAHPSALWCEKNKTERSSSMLL